MLNELQQARRGLAAAGVAIGRRHPDISQPARKPMLKVRLAADGGVTGVETMTAAEASASWTLGDGNHNKFPRVAVRTAKDPDDPKRKTYLPVLSVAPADERAKTARDGKQSFEKRWRAMLELMEFAAVDPGIVGDWPGGGYLRKIAERGETLAPLALGDAAGVSAVFERFLLAAKNPVELFRQIAATVRETLGETASPDLLDAAVGLLLGGDYPVYFDVADGDFDRDVTDPANVVAVSSAPLGPDEEQPAVVGVAAACALSGESDALVKDKFPKPNLPRLGQTYLFARNSATPCTTRYGRTGTASMAVGSATAVALQGAVQSLTATDRQGRTWTAAPSERQDNDLLIAYIAAAPDVEVADLFADEPDDVDARRDATFKTKTARLAEAVKGRLTNQKDEPLLRLMVLRNVDPGNTKVIYSGERSVKRLLKSAEAWTAAFREVPPIRLPVPVGRGQPAAQRGPRAIPPAALVPLSKTQFIRGGREKQDIIGNSFADALTVFWGSEQAAARAARHWLRLFLRRRGEFLVGMGQAQRLGLDALKEFKNGARETLDTVSVLHVLLSKLDPPHTGAVYMNNLAYQLGQVLAAADTLHKGYCQDKRGGAVPPNLIGNSVLPMAQNNPHRALAALGRRWHVYSIWAKTRELPAKPPEKMERKQRDSIYDIWKGVYALRNVEPLAKSLAERLPTTADDAFRAELLLGYMAGPPVTKANDESESNDDASSPDDAQQET